MALINEIVYLKSLFDKGIKFSTLIKEISVLFNCNIYFLNLNGEIIKSYPITNIQFKSEFKERVKSVTQVLENIPLYNGFFENTDIINSNIFMTIIPIRKSISIIGHLLLIRENGGFINDELILVEMAGLLFNVNLFSFNDFNFMVQNENKEHSIDSVINYLSLSELNAVYHTFNEIDGLKGFVNYKKIAERIGLSRAVVNSGIHKLETAGVIKSESLGSKGSYLEILNPNLSGEISKRYMYIKLND